MNILITGCGYVGQTLAEGFIRQGHTVWSLTRKSSPLLSRIHNLHADITDGEFSALLPEKLDLVYFTAAATEHAEDAYRKTYINGLEHTLLSLKKAGVSPRTVFFTSSTGVFHQKDGSWVDETSPTEPTSFSGRVMLEAESLLENSSYQTCSVRFGGIYGPKRARLIEQAVRGELSPPSSEDYYTNRIHVVDCAGSLLHLGALARPAPLYIAVDNSPVRYTEIYNWLCQHIPAKQAAQKATQKPSFSSARTRGNNKRCNNALLLSTGYTFRYPTFREGLAADLASIKGRGNHER